MLPAPLADAGLGKPKGAQFPGPLLLNQSKESAKLPAVLRVLKEHSYGQIADVRIDHLLLKER